MRVELYDCRVKLIVKITENSVDLSCGVSLESIDTL